MNQCGNSNNPHQGDAIKALCVCSAGLLRSPTIAKYLTSKGYNTRACGTSQEYALVPLSEALLFWADEIHVVKEQEDVIRSFVEEYGTEVKVVVLDIPDSYGTFDETLEFIIEDFYTKNG
tara:strand:- start:57 stop:416 length:360 start_codon:yes stop_codon:yes gene_type:complete